MDRPEQRRKGLVGMANFVSEAIDWMDWAEREMRLLKKQLTDTQELLDEAQGVGEPDDG